jgi:hypothetical protein
LSHFNLYSFIFGKKYGKVNFREMLWIFLELREILKAIREQVTTWIG